MHQRVDVVSGMSLRPAQKNGLTGRLKSGPENKSLTVPPLTDRNALPANPAKNRPTSIVSVFFAKAHCKVNRAYVPYAHMYIGLRP